MEPDLGKDRKGACSNPRWALDTISSHMRKTKLTTITEAERKAFEQAKSNQPKQWFTFCLWRPPMQTEELLSGILAFMCLQFLHCVYCISIWKSGIIGFGVHTSKQRFSSFAFHIYLRTYLRTWQHIPISLSFHVSLYPGNFSVSFIYACA